MDEDKVLNYLCVGSASQDVYLMNVDGMRPVCMNPNECFYNVRLGDKIYVNNAEYRTGGGASNGATTLARGGQRVSFMGKIGSDPAANAVIKSFQDEGIDYSAMVLGSQYHTDYSTLLLAPNGERTIFTYRGCGMNFSVDDFDFSRLTQTPDWIYLTSTVAHFDIYDKVLAYAESVGCKIAMNPGGIELDYPDKIMRIIPRVEIFSVNKEEAQKIVSGETIEELARELHKYCPVVIVTDGRNGAVAVDKTGAVRSGMYNETADNVDGTGAGDAFLSGFTLRYSHGCSLEDSVLYASANASSVVQHIGAKPGILRVGDEKKLHPMDIRRIEL